jgi:hypothetical protein
MMSVGNRHIERIADDVDRSRGDRKINRWVPAINRQRLVCFHEDQPIDKVGSMLLGASARSGDLLTMFICGYETENLLKQKLGGARHGKLIELVDLLHLPLARSDVDKVMQEGARPGVARFRIGGEPHNARARRLGSSITRLLLQILHGSDNHSRTFHVLEETVLWILYGLDPYRENPQCLKRLRPSPTVSFRTHFPKLIAAPFLQTTPHSSVICDLKPPVENYSHRSCEKCNRRAADFV